ncbi:helix-turn-helix transcriptional regulator [Maribacter sp. 2210JD10-5]|uniref:helix-turn-helix transcriptional regulator n=1 Tax=Maribacter sp. 2210JD10-5 TaxID=3386272 RepID=UPI0039BD5394
MNTEKIIKRIDRLLTYYELSASNFADKIGVQRSSISHLLKGRNKPSLEFILKIVDNFPEVNLYWLLYGKGTFPSAETSAETQIETVSTKIASTKKEMTKLNSKTSIDKIVIFYTDGTFESFKDSSSDN